jgi:hypothetical protein
MKTEEDEAFEELERKLIKGSPEKRPVCVKLVPTGEFHDGIELVKAVPLESLPLTDFEIKAAMVVSENHMQFARNIEKLVLEKVYV